MVYIEKNFVVSGFIGGTIGVVVKAHP